MKIAAVLHQFPPDFETGTEILCLRSMQALATRGHDVRVFAADPLQSAGRAPRNDNVEGLAVTRIPSRRPRRLTLSQRLTDEFSNPAAQRVLLREVAAFVPDVVHGYQAQQMGLTALPALAASAPLVLTATDFHLACPVVIGAFEDGRLCGGPDADALNCLRHIEKREIDRLREARGPAAVALKARAFFPRAFGHDNDVLREALAKARRVASAKALASAGRILAGSQRIRDMLVAAGASNTTTEIFAHGAPPVTVPPRVVGPVLSVAFLGTIAAHKGPHLLLDAIDRLPADLPLVFTLCGPPGPDPAYVATIAARCASSERATLKPPVRNAAFGALIGEADIIVMPSLWDENRPLTLLSALESGRYVIASDMPGLAAAFTAPEGGTVFPAGDATALAARLRDLALDPAPVHAARRNPSRKPDFDAYIDALEQRLIAAARGAS